MISVKEGFYLGQEENYITGGQETIRFIIQGGVKIKEIHFQDAKRDASQSISPVFTSGRQRRHNISRELEVPGTVLRNKKVPVI